MDLWIDRIKKSKSTILNCYCRPRAFSFYNRRSVTGKGQLRLALFSSENTGVCFSGTRRAEKALQKAVETIEDGIIGPHILMKVQQHETENVIN